MSKQLTFSATAAVLTMAAFAALAGFGGLTTDPSGRIAVNAPLVGLTAAR